MMRLVVVILAALVTTLTFAVPAGAYIDAGDDGGYNAWGWAFACNEYYLGFVALIGNQWAICLSDGASWMWWPL